MQQAPLKASVHQQSLRAVSDNFEWHPKPKYLSQVDELIAPHPSNVSQGYARLRTKREHKLP